MSGGSMDYFYAKVEDAANQFNANTPLRLALRTHMMKLAMALRAVEWNDSGDGDDQEEPLLRDLLSPSAALDEATKNAKNALSELQSELSRL